MSLDPGHRRLSIRRVLERIAAEWTGSDLELEIRSGVPGRFLRDARQGRSREARSLPHWAALLDYLDRLQPAR